jgi:hypothetical protein
LVKLTLIVEGSEDMKRKDAKAGVAFVAFATLGTMRLEARENMVKLQFIDKTTVTVALIFD